MPRLSRMLRVVLKPSRYLLCAFTTAHTTAAVLVLPLQLPASLKATIWLLIAASLVHSLLRHALLRTPNAVIAARIHNSQEATLTLRIGAQYPAQILGTTYVSPFLTVLNARAAGERFPRHMLLTSDNMDPDDYRRLRVILRWSRGRIASAARAKSADGVVR